MLIKSPKNRCMLVPDKGLRRSLPNVFNKIIVISVRLSGMWQVVLPSGISGSSHTESVTPLIPAMPVLDSGCRGRTTGGCTARVAGGKAGAAAPMGGVGAWWFGTSESASSIMCGRPLESPEGKRPYVLFRSKWMLVCKSVRTQTQKQTCTKN